MKRVKDFQTFNESLTNNISFGGSYLGRMIKSTWRFGSAIWDRWFSVNKGSGPFSKAMSNLMSTSQNLFNDDDIIKNAIKTDAQTRFFQNKLNAIVGGSTVLNDPERKQIINLIDEHQVYIKNFKKSSLRDFNQVLMKYKLSLIFELIELDVFKTKLNKLQITPKNDPNYGNALGEYNKSIDNLLNLIDTTNLGLKYKNSLKKFKKALENSKK